jgi:methionyl-tRNA synthetase
MAGFPEKIETSLRNFRFREALSEMMNLARLGNKYLTDNEPWKLFPADPKRTGTILNISLQLCAQLSIVAEPFLPFSAKKIAGMLSLPPLKWKDAAILEWLPAGQKLNPSELVFDKIDDYQIEAQVQRLLETKKNNEAVSSEVTAMKSIIEYDDFSKMDIRTGTILEAEKVPKTKKLLKLTIDTGMDVRTVVSGIAEYFEPSEILGKKVSILVNLAPKNLKGIESKGMILMAENADGKLFFVTPEEGSSNGSPIK